MGLPAMTCAVCETCYEVFKTPYSFFRHINFEIVKKGCHLLQYTLCHMMPNYLFACDYRCFFHFTHTTIFVYIETRLLMKLNFIEKFTSAYGSYILNYDEGCWNEF